MSDLVERLRAMATHHDVCDYHSQVSNEAADELTRLRGINSDLCRKANALTIQSARDAEEITRLRAEAEALRADAGRYRWLRKASVEGWHLLGHYTQDALDAAIDAARGV